MRRASAFTFMLMNEALRTPIGICDFVTSYCHIPKSLRSILLSSLSLSVGNGLLVKDYAQRKAPFVCRLEALAFGSTITGDSQRAVAGTLWLL